MTLHDERLQSYVLFSGWMTGRFISVLILVLWGSAQQIEALRLENVLASAAKELFAVPPATNLIKKYGYPAEVHDTETDDGYILRLDRIPNPGKPVVLLGNALTCNSACYCGLQNNSLAFKLFNSGLDVWMGNFRGCGQSLNHKKLTILNHQFWEYSLHEHGSLDLPAMLDYVVKATGQGPVLYAGHSMGSTAVLITMAERPEHAKLIKASFLLGPAAFLSWSTNKALAAFHKLENVTRVTEQIIGAIPFPFTNYVSRRLGALICRAFVPDSQAYTSCPVLTAISNIGSGAGKVTYPADLKNYIPSGATIDEVLHYAQLANPDWPGFRQFNHGLRKNRQLYGQDVPPDYDLSKSDVPTYVYYGLTDIFAGRENIKLLAANLKNLRKIYEIPEAKFGHWDFILNQDAPSKLYGVILSDIKSVLNAQ